MKRNKSNSKIKISLLDFFRTGNFGPVQLGMTRQEVIDALGEPDLYDLPFGENPSLMEAGLWTYGPIEFYLSPLYTIFTDHIPFEECGCFGESKSVELDAWLFSDQNQPSKAELEAGFAEHNIPYTYLEAGQEDKDRGCAKGKFVLESGVEITIDDVEHKPNGLWPVKMIPGPEPVWIIKEMKKNDAAVAISLNSKS